MLPAGRAARPEIPHLNLADLSWEPVGTRNRRKQLSIDAVTGGLTFYMEIPAGWQGGGVAHYHTCSEEVYVISGDVTLNGRDYLEDAAYLYRPAGIVHGHREGSIGGCRLIIKTDGPLDFNYVEEPRSEEEYIFRVSADGRPHILHLKTPELQWARRDQGASQYGVKVLSQDRNTGAYTGLLLLAAGWAGRFDMSRDANWEWFVIDGDAMLDDGTNLGADSYGFKPAGRVGNAIVRAMNRTRVLLWRD